MTEPEYEYRGLLASTWDLGRGDTSQWADRTLYLDVIRRYGQPVLDVGCGTGRLVLDYLAQGIDTDGVELSPEMLEICREKAQKAGLAANLYLQPMEALDLPRQYKTILVPSSSFQLLTDLEVAKHALAGFYNQLLAGGVLIMSCFLAHREGQPLETDWAMVFEKVRSEDGLTVRRWARETFDRESQLWNSEDRFEILRAGEVVYTENHRRTPAGRWYTQAQITQLYQEVGFTSVQCLHEFTQEPALPEDGLFCVLGVKEIGN